MKKKKSAAKGKKHSLAKKTVKKMTKKGEKAKGKGKVEKVMREYKHGELHSGSKKGPKVKSQKQAIAIGLSEARRTGAKIPKKK
jgi:uncharacterized protein DUF6496